MSVRCRVLDDAQEPAWDRFVDAMPAATFFHRAGWRQVMRRGFNHAPHFLYAERDGAITGILPLAHMKTRLFGHALVSLPFCVYGGPVAADAESEAALTETAIAHMRESGATVLEFRPRDAPAHADAVGAGDTVGASEAWHTRADLYVTFRKRFGRDDDANLKAIPRKQRAMVRKGIDLGLSSTAGQDVDRLHAIYAESVRNLGTPVVSRRYFRVLAEVFRDCLDVVMISDAGTPIAAALNFYFRDEVLPYYGGGRAIARARYANDFLYWEVMRRAAARGLGMFDFGRSKVGTGAFAFKKNWGFSPEPLPYRYFLAPGSTVPDHNPLNPKYRLMIAAWKRLPLPVANLLGPPIVRGLG